MQMGCGLTFNHTTCQQLSWQCHGLAGDVQHRQNLPQLLVSAALCPCLAGAGVAHGVAVEDSLMMPPALAEAGLSDVTQLLCDTSGWPWTSDL